MDLSIKNMVCGRCLKTITTILKETGVEIHSVQLGKAIIGDGMTPEQLQKLRKKLEAEGFELLDNQKAKLIQHIKQHIIELVHYNELDQMNENLSGYLARNLNKDYHYLTNLFSSIENTTIEQYFILQKIEKVLERAGATMKDVIRTRVYVTDISKWEEIGKAHADFFNKVKPAATMVEVKSLIDPDLLIEIEVTAYVI